MGSQRQHTIKRFRSEGTVSRPARATPMEHRAGFNRHNNLHCFRGLRRIAAEAYFWFAEAGPQVALFKIDWADMLAQKKTDGKSGERFSNQGGKMCLDRARLGGERVAEFDSSDCEPGTLDSELLHRFIGRRVIDQIMCDAQSWVPQS